MASTSETGHANNVALFNELITICKGFGSRYKPALKKLELASVTAQAKEGEMLQAALNKAIAPRTTAVAKKDKAFEGMSKRVTRALSAYKSCKPLPGELHSAQTIARLIKGEKGNGKKTPDKEPKDVTEGPVPKGAGNEQSDDKSNSRMGVDSRVENLNRFIEGLVSSGVYVTNEEEITIAALTDYSNTLKVLSKAVTEAEQPEGEARKLRDAALYTPDTGILDIAQGMKDYVKSAFGTRSPEYKAVARIQFKRPKKG
jgi:hypothetical protein